jgi:membrane protein required for beta-lactamase induction
MPIKDNNSNPSRARLIGNILLLVAGTFLLLNLLSSLLFGPSIT